MSVDPSIPPTNAQTVSTVKVRPRLMVASGLVVCVAALVVCVAALVLFAASRGGTPNADEISAGDQTSEADGTNPATSAPEPPQQLLDCGRFKVYPGVACDSVSDDRLRITPRMEARFDALEVEAGEDVEKQLAAACEITDSIMFILSDRQICSVMQGIPDDRRLSADHPVAVDVLERSSYLLESVCPGDPDLLVVEG